MFADVACQTSLSPGCPLERLTSVHVTPPPETTAVWPPERFGPSADTNANSVSPAIAVWNDGVVTVFLLWTLTCACSTKHVIGGAGFWTVTSTLAEVPTFPLVSVALALSTWLPDVAAVVSQLTAYGALVTALPSAFPSRKNCTEATATSSVALAATGVVPETVCASVGFVMPIVGGVVSGGGGGLLCCTLTMIAVAVA